MMMMIEEKRYSVHFLLGDLKVEFEEEQKRKKKNKKEEGKE